MPLRLEMGEPGMSLASDWSAFDRVLPLRRDFALRPDADSRLAEERRERVPSVVVEALSVLSEEVVEEESVLEESELEELDESPKKALSLAMVRP